VCLAPRWELVGLIEHVRAYRPLRVKSGELAGALTFALAGSSGSPGCSGKCEGLMGRISDGIWIAARVALVGVASLFLLSRAAALRVTRSVGGETNFRLDLDLDGSAVRTASLRSGAGAGTDVAEWRMAHVSPSRLIDPPGTLVNAWTIPGIRYESGQEVEILWLGGQQVRIASGTYRQVRIRWWLAVLLSAIWAAATWGIRRRTQALASRQSPVCRRCGYDLRASSARCPECGQPIPSGPVAAPQKRGNAWMNGRR
jgi:hypothetical protein